MSVIIAAQVHLPSYLHAQQTSGISYVNANTEWGVRRSKTRWWFRVHSREDILHQMLEEK